MIPQGHALAFISVVQSAYVMHRILFVCHGNICRSPMAEFIMKDVVNRNGCSDMFEIESCATSTEEIGNDIYPPAKAELDRHGVAYTRRAARRMRYCDYENFDMIVAMDAQNLRNMRGFVGDDPDGKVSLMMSHAGEDRGVADPWYTGDFSKTYADLRRSCEAIFDKLVNGDR